MWAVFWWLVLALALMALISIFFRRSMRGPETTAVDRRRGLWETSLTTIAAGVVLLCLATALTALQAETTIRAERRWLVELAARLTDSALAEIRGGIDELELSDLGTERRRQLMYGRPLGVEILLRSEAHMAVATAEDRTKLQRGLGMLPIQKHPSPWVESWEPPPVEEALEALGYLASELERQSELRRPGAG